MRAAATGQTDPGLVDRIERHAATCWPAQFVREYGDGWLLRATPKLIRGRSNNALTPRRALRVGELDGALEAAAGWAAEHRSPLGMQVVPSGVHRDVISSLKAVGWSAAPPVIVMGVDVRALDFADALALEVSRGITPEWAEAWMGCDPSHSEPTARAHIESVFTFLGERAVFARSGGDEAVGFSCEFDGLVGLFALAVRPEVRHRGLGRRLVTGMLARVEAPLAYLQVSSENRAGLALYERLGFRELYRYRHLTAPGYERET